jgi:hypothetical protein
MSKTKLAVWATALLLSGIQVAGAEKVLRVIENSYESTTHSVDLPSSASGRLSVRPCETCPLETHPLADSSQYFIGREAVSYAEFRAFVLKNSRGLMIHFDPTTKVITRLVVRN